MLSNNHVFGFGVKGLRDTMKTLEGAGLPYTGVGENDTDTRKPYFIEQDGKRILPLTPPAKTPQPLPREVLCGADVVLTQHSHCVGCYEQFEGGHIVYRQGNFNFVYEELESEEWNTSLHVEVDINKTVSLSFYPVTITETGCDLAKGEQALEILKGFK